MPEIPENFVAFDFETANRDPASACEIGLVKVVSSRIISEHAFRIRPPTKRFLPRFVDLHGITWDDVRTAPIFSDLWPELRRILGGGEFLVAHNIAFDRNVLSATCEYYGLPLPRKSFLCSMNVAKEVWSLGSYRLDNVCRRLNIPLIHHHSALDDARACAMIMIQAATASGKNLNKAFAREAGEARDPSGTSRKRVTHIFPSPAPSHRKEFGDWGERTAMKILGKADFSSIKNLNETEPNHPFGDILAHRDGRNYLISVKARNALTQAGKLNSAYNVRTKGKNVQHLEKRYDARLAWIAIQVFVDDQRYNAYYGTLDDIGGDNERHSIPMSHSRTKQYECLARNRLDRKIRPEWSNRPA